MHTGDHNVRTVFPQTGRTVFHLLRRAVVPQHIDAHPQGGAVVVPQVKACALILLNSGDARLLQCRGGIVHPGFPKIIGVIVAHGHTLHAAERQGLGVFRLPAEGVFRRGFQPLFRKTAFQIGQGQVIRLQDFRHVGKGVLQIVAYQAFKVVCVVAGGQGAVP